MGYQEAMEAAGARVFLFEHFGSYQGDWWALVSYGSKVGWVNGSYGSCPVCDAFEAEFDRFVRDDENEDGYQQRLAEFGERYLDLILTQDEAIKLASTHLGWDMDAKEMVDFIRNNGVEVAEKEEGK